VQLITIGQHIFEEKNFKDFADIYAASEIFILNFLQKYQNQWHFSLSLKICQQNFNLRLDSGNPQNFISLKICRPIVFCIHAHEQLGVKHI